MKALSKTVFPVRVESADMDFNVDVEAMLTSLDYVVDYGLKQCLNDAVAGAKAAAIKAIADAIPGDKKVAKAKADLAWGQLSADVKEAATKVAAQRLAQARFKALMEGAIRAGRTAKTLADIVRDALAKAVPGWAGLDDAVQADRVAFVVAGEGLKPGAQKLLDECRVLFNGTSTGDVDLF